MYTYVHHYLSGLSDRPFLSALADQLLYLGLAKHRIRMDRALFEALMCASGLSSVFAREVLKKSHRKLQKYLENATSTRYSSTRRVA